MSTIKGDRFSDFLKEIGVSATVLALELNISRRMIYNYKDGSNVIPLEVLEILRDKYRLNLDWYLREEGSMFLYETHNDAVIPGNDRLTALLTEAYNSLPKQNQYLIAEIKKEFLKKESTVSINDEALELLKKIHDKVDKRVI